MSAFSCALLSWAAFCLSLFFACRTTELPAPADAAALTREAENLMNAQRLDEAHRKVKQAISIYEAGEDREGLADAYNLLGYISKSRHAGELYALDEAEQAFLRSMAAGRAAESIRWQAEGHLGLGMVFHQRVDKLGEAQHKQAACSHYRAAQTLASRAHNDEFANTASRYAVQLQCPD